MKTIKDIKAYAIKTTFMNVQKLFRDPRVPLIYGYTEICDSSYGGIEQKATDERTGKGIISRSRNGNTKIGSRSINGKITLIRAW